MVGQEGRPSRRAMRISSAFSSPDSAADVEAGADLHALHGVDAHQARGDVLVELAVERCAEPGGHAVRHDLDHGAGGRARLAHLVEEFGPILRRSWVGAEERVVRRPRPSSSWRGRSCAGPTWTSAPRTRKPGTTFRATAPAATRVAVSRAEARPEPRQSRTPYFSR